MIIAETTVGRGAEAFEHYKRITPAYREEISDVHRAGGIMGILGELNRAGLIHRHTPTVHSKDLGEALDIWDVMHRSHDLAVYEFFKAAPGGVPTQVAFSQDRRYPELDLDRTHGCIRDFDNAYSKEGGLAVLNFFLLRHVVYR